MVDSNFSFFSHLVGRRGLARHPASDTAGKKRISNFEQGMPNYEVFSPFDIYPPIFWGGFYYLFDILRFYLVNPRTLESLWLYLLTNSFGDVSNINALMVYRQEEFWWFVHFNCFSYSIAIYTVLYVSFENQQNWFV